MVIRDAVSGVNVGVADGKGVYFEEQYTTNPSPITAKLIARIDLNENLLLKKTKLKITEKGTVAEFKV